MKKNIKNISLSLCAIFAIVLGILSVKIWQEYNSFHPEDYIAAANAIETSATPETSIGEATQALYEADTIRLMAERDGVSIGVLFIPGILVTLLTIVFAIPCLRFLWVHKKTIPAIQI